MNLVVGGNMIEYIPRKQSEMKSKNIGSPYGSPVIGVAGFIIVIAGVIYAKSLITPLLLAFFISVICEQPITWLEKKKIPNAIAVVMVLLGVAGLFSGFAFLIGGSLSSFTGNVSRYETALTTILKSFIVFLNSKGFSIRADQVTGFIQPARILEITAGAVNELLNMMGNTFLIFLVVLFTLMESGSFTVKVKAVMAGSERSFDYITTITKNIRHYLAIKTFICLLTGICIYLALLVIGVEYPLLWALIAALMNYIPNIGSIIAVVPAFLFALVQTGVGGAFWTLGAFMLVNNLLGNFVEPKIMGRGMGQIGRAHV